MKITRTSPVLMRDRSPIILAVCPRKLIKIPLPAAISSRYTHMRI